MVISSRVFTETVWNAMAKPMSPFYLLFYQLLVSVDKNKRDGKFWAR